MSAASRVVVTGAAGRLGSPLVRALHERGFDVLGSDVRPLPESMFPFRQADLLDADQARDIMEGRDALVHLANHPNLRGHVPQHLFNENVRVDMNVFQGAAERGVQRIVFASSVQLVGSHVDARTVLRPPEPPAYPLDGATPASPANAYALSKQVGEIMLRYYAERCGVDAVAVRFPWICDCRRTVPRHVREPGESQWREGLGTITFSDAAGLIEAILGADLPGFRVYMPGVTTWRGDGSLSDAIRTRYPGLPPGTTDLVDRTVIREETGWEPRDEYGSGDSRTLFT